MSQRVRVESYQSESTQSLVMEGKSRNNSCHDEIEDELVKLIESATKSKFLKKNVYGLSIYGVMQL